jgi:hypothetical protein
MKQRLPIALVILLLVCVGLSGIWALRSARGEVLAIWDGVDALGPSNGKAEAGERSVLANRLKASVLRIDWCSRIMVAVTACSVGVAIGYAMFGKSACPPDADGFEKTGGNHLS